MNMLEIAKDVYTFGCILTGLELEDFKQRVTYLTEQNIKWHTKAEALEAELILCQKKYDDLQKNYESLVTKEG